MAIAKTVRPDVLLYGTVDSVRELKKKPENGGDLYGHEVTLRQPNGSAPAFTVYLSNDRQFQVGEFCAVEVTIDESRQFGASLSYKRAADNALDQILNGLKAA